jgi:serine/threonine protein kinase
VIDEIGRGAFARAYLCREPGVGDRQVVVKLAQAGAAEAQMLGQLDHPHIMPIHSVQEEPVTGLTAICMPFRGRSTLQDVLDLAFAEGGPAPCRAAVILQAARSRSCGIDRCQQVAETSRFRTREGYVTSVLRLALQMADALRHAHSRGILHGDLKPSNVVMSMEASPLLVDFNLAQRPGAASSRIGGTLPYMAPEQLALVLQWQAAEQLPRNSIVSGAVSPDLASVHPTPDARADVFAWGVLVWELLTGTLPWDPGEPTWHHPGWQAMETHLRRMRATVPSWPAVSFVERPVRELLQSCLSAEPDARPLNMHSVCQTLRRELKWHRRIAREWRSRPRWRRRLLAGSVLAACAFAYNQAQHTPDREQLLQEARSLYDNQDFAAAIESLNRVVQLDPDYGDAYLTRACCSILLYQRDGYRLRLDAASGDLANAMRHAPSLDTQRVQAYCLMKQGEFEMAAEGYKAILERESKNDVESLNNLAYCYEKVTTRFRDQAEVDHYLKEADRLLSIAVSLSPDDWRPHLNRAIAGLRKVRLLDSYVPEDEMKSAIRCVALNPNDAGSFYLASTLTLIVGLKQSNEGLIDDGMQYARKAVELGHKFSAPEDAPRVFAYPYSEFSSDPRFLGVLAMPESGREATSADRMIMPAYLRDFARPR